MSGTQNHTPIAHSIKVMSDTELLRFFDAAKDLEQTGHAVMEDAAAAIQAATTAQAVANAEMVRRLRKSANAEMPPLNRKDREWRPGEQGLDTYCVFRKLAYAEPAPQEATP